MATVQRFDGYSGNAAIASGAVAFFAGAAQMLLCPFPATPSEQRAVTSTIWLLCLGIALAINYGAILVWRTRNHNALADVQMRNVGMSIFPAVAAGGVITAALVMRGLYDLLPGMWCAIYALGLFASRSQVPREVVLFAIAFGAAACALLFLPGTPRSRGGSCRSPSAAVKSPSVRSCGRDAGREQRGLAMNSAPFAYEGLERIFHERGRLAVCTALVAMPTPR